MRAYCSENLWRIWLPELNTSLDFFPLQQDEKKCLGVEGGQGTELLTKPIKC